MCRYNRTWVWCSIKISSRRKRALRFGSFLHWELCTTWFWIPPTNLNLLPKQKNWRAIPSLVLTVYWCLKSNGTEYDYTYCVVTTLHCIGSSSTHNRKTMETRSRQAKKSSATTQTSDGRGIAPTDHSLKTEFAHAWLVCVSASFHRLRRDSSVQCILEGIDFKL